MSMGLIPFGHLQYSKAPEARQGPRGTCNISSPKLQGRECGGLLRFVTFCNAVSGRDAGVSDEHAEQGEGENEAGHGVISFGHLYCSTGRGQHLRLQHFET